MERRWAAILHKAGQGKRHCKGSSEQRRGGGEAWARMTLPSAFVIAVPVHGSALSELCMSKVSTAQRSREERAVGKPPSFVSLICQVKLNIFHYAFFPLKCGFEQNSCFRDSLSLKFSNKFPSSHLTHQRARVLPNPPRPHWDTPTTTGGLTAQDGKEPSGHWALFHCGEASAFLEVSVGKRGGCWGKATLQRQEACPQPAA